MLSLFHRNRSVPRRPFAWIVCLSSIAIIAVAPSGWAKPKLENGSCKIPVGCTGNTVNATCAKIYCRALRAKCKGDYSSGDCKDIKDLHKEGKCSAARKGCGETLPRILTLGDLEISLDGEVFVAVDPRDEETDFDSMFDAVAHSVANLDPAVFSPKGGDTRTAVFLCAQETLVGVATARYASSRACNAGRQALETAAVSDSKSRCDDFCQPTGCTANRTPSPPALRGNASQCRGPDSNQQYYRSARTQDVVCRCTRP